MPDLWAPGTGAQATETETPESVAIERALHWLAGSREWFVPERWEQYLPKRPLAFTPLIELAATLDLVEERGDHLSVASHEDRAALRQSVDAAAASETYARTMRERGGREALPWLLAVGAGHHRGACSAYVELLRSHTFTSPMLPSSGLARLEAAFVGACAGVVEHEELRDELRAWIRAVQPRAHALLAYRSADRYALTHAILLGSAFGRVGLPGEAHADWIAWAVALFGSTATARGDADLAAEFATCAAVLGFRLPAIESFVDAMQQAAGMVLGPHHDPGVAGRLTGEVRSAYDFGSCFHATLAAVNSWCLRPSR